MLLSIISRTKNIASPWALVGAKINRLNPEYKIDLYKNAVSNKSETVYFENVAGCNCKDCCGGISQKSSSSKKHGDDDGSHPVTSVRKGTTRPWVDKVKPKVLFKYSLWID